MLATSNSIHACGTGRLSGNAGFSAGSGAINPLLPGGAIPNSDTGVTTNNAVLHLGETNAIKGGNGLMVYGGTLSLGTFSPTLRTVTLSTGTISGADTLTGKTTVNKENR